MDRHAITRTRTPGEATALVGLGVPDITPNVTDAGVYADADTDTPVFAYLPLAAWVRVLLRRNIVGYRVSAVTRNANYSTRSTTFGYSPRAAINRREGCQLSAFGRDELQREAALDSTANVLRNMMIDIDPALVDRDRDRLSVIKPDWFLGEQELWTSGVINQDSQLPYHRDSFNFPTWSAMPVLRRAMDGGHLHIPEYDAVIACRDGFAVFFPGHDLVHGVTPMRARTKDAYRYSIVYYALRGMKDCHTAAEETAYARRRRTEREIEMATKIKEATT
jgi:hypothetical protein